MRNLSIARSLSAVALSASFVCCSFSFAQNATPSDNHASASADSTDSTQQQDPLKRELPEKERKERKKALHEELEESYKKWLNEDVLYIITPEERAAFKKLSNNEERDSFIENFWLRRDPTPDTEENEFKEEHYRRIAYANEHFAAGKPGWRTDRGRIYIVFGKPDEIESHPSGGTYERPAEEGGGETSTYPFEQWRYRYIEGIGNEIIIEFVDSCMCGDYHMTLDRGEKDALLHVPGAGLTTYEQMGMSDKGKRFGGMETLGEGPFTSMNGAKQFDRLEQWGKINSIQPIKLKDFDEIVTHKINLNPLPFDVRTDYVKVTSGTVLVPITIQIHNKDITYVTKDGVSRGVVNITGRVTTLSTRVVQTFEQPVQVDSPAELLQQEMDRSSVYWYAVPLHPGRYRLDIVVKDANGDKAGLWSRGIEVPNYGDDKLSASSLILADKMERVPAKSVGSGQFVIGSTFVRPRVDAGNGQPAVFKRSQRLNFWMQVYNLGIDDKTNKNSAQIEYDIVNTSTNKPVLQASETGEQLGVHSDQLTIEKSLSLASLPPGQYRVTIKVNDNISKQAIAPTASFLVE